jgi:hypothetical protein
MQKGKSGCKRFKLHYFRVYSFVRDFGVRLRNAVLNLSDYVSQSLFCL